MVAVTNIAATRWITGDPREALAGSTTIIASAAGVSRAWVQTKHGYHIELQTPILASVPS